MSIFAEDQPSRLSFVWGHAHYIKGFEVRRCRHNLPYTGQSCVSNLSHTLRKYLAFNTALVTRGNSGLHRLNSSLKSSDIPLPTQSPKWVTPMGPIKLSFGKTTWQPRVTTCKLAAENVLSFLPHRLRSLHQDISLIWLIKNQHSVPIGIHVNETRSEQSARAACTQWSAWRCALFDVNKPAPVAAVQ